MKRHYLTHPGDKVTITITGPSAAGKTSLIMRLQELLESEGLMTSGISGGYKSGLCYEFFQVECPTPAQRKAMYFETLGEHEVATLKGHLAALGYELE